MARIAVFKGRDARLNKAIFWILAQQGPLTIYDIWRKLRTQRDFIYVRYNTVNRRVRALEEHGYIEKSVERKTKTGFKAMLYQLTARAYLAILLDKINLDAFIEKAPEACILSVLSVLSLSPYRKDEPLIWSGGLINVQNMVMKEIVSTNHFQ